mgnify:FL=1
MGISKPDEMQLAAAQFAEMAGLIYSKIYSTLKAEGIPEEKLEAMTQNCFSTMAATIAHTVSAKLGDMAKWQINELMEQVLRKSAASYGN